MDRQEVERVKKLEWSRCRQCRILLPPRLLQNHLHLHPHRLQKSRSRLPRREFRYEERRIGIS